MDSVDERILSILRRNGRTPFLEIAKKINISEGTVRKRVKDMQKTNIIEKFTIETRTETDFRSVICIKLKSNVSAKKVVEKLKATEYEINHIFEVAGDYDIICVGETHSHKEMNELLEKIRELPEIYETKSYVVLVMR
jgi:DNA-binding Lrp family transcriptional regulator